MKELTTRLVEETAQKVLNKELHDGGDCGTLTYCMCRYLTEMGIDGDNMLKVRYGVITDQKGHFMTPHMWLSYDNKTVDVTSHRQAHEKATAVILGVKIGTKKSGKRVSANRLTPADRHSIVQQRDTVPVAVMKRYGFDGYISANEYVSFIDGTGADMSVFYSYFLEIVNSKAA